MLAQIARLFQIRYMSHMQNIKAAVSENDFFTAGLPRCGQLGNLLPAQCAVAAALLALLGQQILQQLVAVYRIGANLRHNNASCTVRHKDSVRQLQLASCTCQQRCCHRIACARHIEHLDSRRRTMQHLRAVDKAHAALAARNHHVFNIKFLTSSLRHRHHCLVLIFLLAACSLAHLLEIRRNKITAAVLLPVGTLRINEHRNIIGMSLRNHPLTELV